MKRALGVALLVLGLAACGGGDGSTGTGTIPAGAELVPADVAAFVAVDTSFDGEQWENARKLLDRFPDGDRLLASLRKELSQDDVDLERDVKPALGDELVLAVWGELEQEDAELVVALTQPRDEAKLRELVAKDPEAETVLREIRGWTALAETEADLDDFERRLDGPKLADADGFREAMERTPDDSALRYYVRGAFLQEAFDQGIAEEDGPPRFTRRLGTLESFAGAYTVEEDGVRSDDLIITSPDVGFGGFEPELPAALPEGALLYVGYANLGGALERVLREVEKSIPDARAQLRDFQDAMGFDVRSDLFPLLDGEAAFAVYPGSPLPTFTFVQAVENEQDAQRLLRRFAALMNLAGAGTRRESAVEGLRVTELRFLDEGFSLFHAVFDDKIVLSSTKAGVAAVHRDGPKFEDDETFAALRESADFPDEPAAFVYANLARGLPLLYDYAELSGEPVPEDVRRNTAPLHSLVYFLAERDGAAALTGFVRIAD